MRIYNYFFTSPQSIAKLSNGLNSKLVELLKRMSLNELSLIREAVPSVMGISLSTYQPQTRLNSLR